MQNCEKHNIRYLGNPVQNNKFSTKYRSTVLELEKDLM